MGVWVGWMDSVAKKPTFCDFSFRGGPDPLPPPLLNPRMTDILGTKIKNTLELRLINTFTDIS